MFISASALKMSDKRSTLRKKQVSNKAEMLYSNSHNKRNSYTEIKSPEKLENKMNDIDEDLNLDIDALPQSNNLIKKKVQPFLGYLNEMIFYENGKKNFNNFNCVKSSEFLIYQNFCNSIYQCVFTFTSVTTAFINYEIEYSVKDEYFVDLTNWISLVTSICLWATIIYEFFINCRLQSIFKKIPERILVKHSYLSLLATLALFLSHPNPLFKGINLKIYNYKYGLYSNHSLNSILSALCLLRMWYFFKFFLVSSYYYSPRCQRVCRMNGFDTSLKFTMKAVMKKIPYKAYMILFLIVLLFCTYSLRIFERDFDEISGKNFGNYWNTIWCLVITMTTVGYGDFYPSSTFGRASSIISCICGLFCISMLIVTVTNVLQFEHCEESVYLILKRIGLSKDKDKLAASLVSKYLRLMKLLKCKNDPVKYLHERKQVREDILYNLRMFTEKCKEFDSTFPAYSSFDNVLDNLSMFDASMANVEKKCETLEIEIGKLVQKLI